MKLLDLSTDQAVLEEVGARLARRRLTLRLNRPTGRGSASARSSGSSPENPASSAAGFRFCAYSNCSRQWPPCSRKKAFVRWRYSATTARGCLSAFAKAPTKSHLPAANGIGRVRDSRCRPGPTTSRHLRFAAEPMPVVDAAVAGVIRPSLRYLSRDAICCRTQI